MKNLIMIKQKVDGIQIDGDSSKGISMKKKPRIGGVRRLYRTKNNKRKRATMGIVARFLLII